MSVGELTANKHRNLMQPWKPGQSGNPAGRPKGSRHKLSEEFIADLHESWLEHGKAAIAKVIKDKPAEYLKVITRVLPKEVKIDPQNPVDQFDDGELALAITILKQAIADHPDNPNRIGRTDNSDEEM